MVQSPSWEANWFAVSQEIPRISRNPKVHYRTHKRPPPLSILGQPNPVYIPTSHLLEIHPNIIHPSTPRSPQWSPSLRFPHEDPIHPLSSPIRATCPAHLIFKNIHNRKMSSCDYHIGQMSNIKRLHVSKYRSTKNVEELRQSSKYFSFDSVGDELSGSRSGRFFPTGNIPPLAFVGGCTGPGTCMNNGKRGS